MWIYNLGLVLYVWAIALLLTLAPKGETLDRRPERLFRRMKESIDPSARIIWIHAASLGEFEQGRPLIEKIRKEHPEYKILLTFFLPSGYEIRKNYDQADFYIFYLPIDTPRKARRFLDIAHPEIAIFVKYEFWINLLTERAAARSAATSYRPSSAATRSSSAPTEAIGAWHSKVSTRSSFRTTIPKITGRTGLRQRRSRRRHPLRPGCRNCGCGEKNRPHRTVQRRHPSVDRRLDLGTGRRPSDPPDKR